MADKPTDNLPPDRDDAVDDNEQGDATTASEPTEAGAENGNLRLFRLRRRLILFFIVVVMTVGALLVAANSRMGGQALLALINSALQQTGGGVLRADLRVNLLAGKVHAQNLSLDLGKNGSIFADEAVIAVKPLQLLYNRIIINEIRIERPIVQLDWTQSSDGSGTPLDIGQLLDLPFDIVLHRLQINSAELQVNSGGEFPSELKRISLRSEYIDGAYQVQMESGSGKIFVPGISFPINLISGDIQIRDGDVALKSLNVFLPDVTLALSGHFARLGTGELVLNLDLDLPLAKLSGAIDELPKMTGTAKFSGQISGDPTAPKATGSLKLRDVAISRYVVEDADIVFALDQHGLVLDDTVFYVGDSEVKLTRATIKNDANFTTSVEIDLKELELAHLLANVALLDSHTSQYQSGTITLDGTLKPVDLEGFADLIVRDHRTHTVGFSERGPGTEIIHVPLGYVKSPIALTDRFFEFRKGKVYVGETIIDMPITHLGFDSVFHLEYGSRQFRFKDSGPLVGMPMTGSGSLECIIHVENHQTDITGWLDIVDYGVSGFKLGNMRTDLVLDHGKLIFRESNFTLGDSAYHTKLTFDFNKHPFFIGVDFSTDSLYVDDLFTIIGQEDLKQHFNGRLVGNGTFYGPFGTFSGEARLVMPEFGSPHQQFDSGIFEASLQNNLLTLKRFELRRAGGKLWLEGTLDNWDALDIHIRSDEVALSEVNLAVDLLGHDITGKAGANGQIIGTWREPILRAAMFWTDAVIGGTDYGTSEWHLEWSREYLDLHGKFFDSRADYSLVWLFSPERRLDLDVTLENFPYPLAMQRYLGIVVDGGIISGRATARIPQNKPKAATGKATISALTFSRDNVAFKNKQPAEIRLADGIFHLDPVRLAGKGLAMDVSGDVDFNGGIAALIKGRTDWRLMALLIDDLEEAQGLLDFDLTVGGRWGSTALTGKASFEQTRLKIAGVETPLDNVRGSVLLDVNRVEIADLSFDYGGGTVSISGFTGLAFPAFEPGNVNLRVDLNQVGLELRNGFMPVLSGRLTISGKPWPLLVEGALHVDEAVYSHYISWQKTLIIDRIMSLIRPRSTRTTQRENPLFKFQVSLNAPGTLILRNNLARLDLTADLMLTGTDISPGLLNTVSANRGYIYFLQNEFEVSRFMIDFEKPDSIYPRFDIYGETTVEYIENDIRKEVTITLSLVGTLDDTEIILGSDAGLSQTDIVTLLVTGQPASALDGAQGVATGLNALSALYGVNDQIRHTFKLDEFRLTSGYAGSGSSDSGLHLVPKLVIGKEVAEDVYLTYTTTVGDTGDQQDQRFEIRYRFDPWMVSVEWDNDSTLQQGNFGADLTFHIDF